LIPSPRETRMPKRKKKIEARDTFKWKRQSTGHYILWGEFVVQEKEIMAEVKKEKNKWKYCLWTWGTQEPGPTSYSWETFKSAKEVKEKAIELVLLGEPKVG